MVAVVRPDQLALLRVSHSSLTGVASWGGTTRVDVIEVRNVWHVPRVSPWGDVGPRCNVAGAGYSSDVLVRRSLAERIAAPCALCRRHG